MTHNKPLYTKKKVSDVATNYRFGSIATNAIKSIDRNFKLGIVVSFAAAMYLSEFGRTANASELNSSIAQSSSSKSTTSSFKRSQYRYNLLPKIFARVFSNKSQQVKLPKGKSVETNASVRREPKPSNIIASVSSPITQQRTHQVKPGDTINRIAEMYRVSKDELVKLNKIPNSNIIFVNQRLKIPVATNKILPSNNSGRSLLATSQSQVEQGKAFKTTSVNSDKLAQKTSTTSLQSPNEFKSPVKGDPHLSRLQADIELLRKQQYEAQSTRKSTPSDLDSVTVPLAANTSETEQTELQETSISTVNVDSLPSSSAASSQLEDAIALTLPPLPPSSEYLPSAFDGYIWPAQGVLTSGYGWRWGRMHRGIDIAAPVGTPILAAATGTVINVGWQSGYGNLVKLEHLDGSVTVYAHNHRNLVTHGQKVEQGQQIAEMGNTGHSTGPHLHFEIHSKDKAAIDPLALLESR